MKTLKKIMMGLAAVVGFTTAALAAVPSGTKVVSYSGKTLPQWTTGDSGIYDYTYAAFKEGGMLEMSFSLNYNGQTASGVQGIFHAGMDGTGLSIKQTSGARLIFSIKNETGTAYQVGADLVTGDNTVVCRFEGTGDGTANASVTLNGTRYDLGSWTLASMNWNSDAGERNKYSMGCRAPGWSEQPLTTSTIADNTITATYTACSIPDPVAVWDRDFAGASGASGAQRGDFTLRTTDGGTVASDGSYVTVGGTSTKTGALVDWATSVATSEEGFKNRQITMIVRYENLQSAGNIQAISTLWASTDGSEETAERKDSLGFLADHSGTSPAHKSYGISSGGLYNYGETREGIPCETSSAQNSMAITYGVDEGYKAYFRTGQEATFTAKYASSGLKLSGYNLYGAAIGGTRMTPSTSSWQAAKQMRICAVAVFNTVLTPAQIAAYKFPNDPTSVNLKWGNIGTSASNPGICNGSSSGGAYTGFNFKFSATDNISQTQIPSTGKVKIKQIRLVRRDGKSGGAPATVTLTQGSLSVTSSSTTTKTGQTIWWADGSAKTVAIYEINFNSDTLFDASQNIAMSFASSEIYVLKPKNSVLYCSTDWSPAMDVLGDAYNITTSEKYHNRLSTGSTKVPADTYGAITVGGAGYKATAFTELTTLSNTASEPEISGNYGSIMQTGHQIISHTVAGWFNVGALPTGDNLKTIYIAHACNATHNGYKVVVDADGKILIGKTNYSSGTYPWQGAHRTTVDAVVTANKWFHLAIANTYSSSSNAKTCKPVIYINGATVEVDSGTFEANVNNGTCTDFKIGAGISAAGIYVDNNALSNASDVLYVATDSRYVVPAPYTFEATVPQGGGNWSQLVWTPTKPTFGFPDGSNFILTNNGADGVTTVTVDSAINAGNLKIISAAGKELKLANFGANMTVGSVDFSAAPGGVGLDVTGGWTASSAINDYFRDNEVKVTFYGSGDNGATVGYTSDQDKAFQSHLVFNGGTHTFSYGRGTGGNFAQNATAANPTLLVKDGTTLNFPGHDLGGWTGTANVNAIVQVEAGGKLYAKKQGGTFYYHQRFTINPGAELYVDTTDADNFRLEGGVDENATQIYVPEGSGTAYIKPVNAANDSIHLHHDTDRGVGITVGAGATLDIQTKITNEEVEKENHDFEIGKYGAGLLKLSGDISGYWNQGYDKVVKFSVYAGDIELASATEAKCRFWLASNSNLRLTGHGTTVSGELQGPGNLVRNGEGVVTLTGANNNYQGTTTVEAGTLKVAEGSSIGSGNYSVAAGATLDLPSTFRPASSPKLVASSAGTLGITLTAAEMETFEGGTAFTIDIPVEGETLSTTIKVYDVKGTEHTIEPATIVGGKISIQKKQNAKVSPFNLTTTEDGVNYWESFAWKDSTPGSPRDVEAADWATKVDANIVIPQDVSNELYVYETPITLAALHITNAYALAISDFMGGTITVDSIDDSASTGWTTIDFALDTAAVAAGANTVLTKIGGSAVTVGEGKTVTLPGGWTTPANVTGAGTVKIVGAEKATEITWGPNGITGTNMLVSGTWAITDGGQYIGAKPFWIRGSNAVFNISGKTDILHGQGSNPIYVEDGGEFQVFDRDTCGRALTLSNGGKMTFDGDDGGSGRAFDFYTDSSLAIKGTVPCVIGGLTAESTTDSGKIAIRRSNFTVTVDEGATLKCYSQWTTADGSGNNFIKAGLGTWEQYRSAADNSLGFVVQAGTLKLVNGGNVTATGGITVNADASLEINTTSDQTYANAFSGAGAITKTGAGTLTLTGSPANFTGVLTVSEGTIKVTDDAWLTGGKLKFAEGTGLVFYDKTSYDGVKSIVLASDSVQPTITVKSAADESHEYGATVSGSLPNLTVSYTPWVSGKGAWYAWEFNGNLNQTGRQTGTSQGNDHSAVYSNNMVNAYAMMWSAVQWPTEFTVSIACTLPDKDDATAIGWGKAAGGIALITGDISENKVKMVYWPKNTHYTVLKEMYVPNATTSEHLFVVVKTADHVKVYLDGSLVVNYAATFSLTENGFQLGSVYTGVYSTGITRLDSTYGSAAECNAYVDSLRIYDSVLGPNAIAQLKEEFKYVSPNGTYSRALAGTAGTWEQTEAWKKTKTGEPESQVDVPGAGATVDISAAADATIANNLDEAAGYEAINLSGEGTVTIAAANDNANKITTAALKVGANANIKYSAVDLANTPIEITAGKTLTIDASMFPLTNYFVSTSVPLTGLVTADDETTQLVITPPASTAERTVKVMKNTSTDQWDLKLTITPQPFVYTVAQGSETGTWTWGTQTVTAEQVAAQTSGEIQKAGLGTGTLEQKAGFNYTVNENGGTLKFSSVVGNAASITVNNGGTFDLNGKSGTAYGITLAGGSLVNNGSKIGDGNTFTNLTLTANSTVGGLYDVRIQKASYGATTIDLGTFTLEKQGTNTLMLITTTVKGTGTLNVSNGTLRSNESTSFADGGKLQIGATGVVSQRGGRKLTVGTIIGTEGGQLVIDTDSDGKAEISAFTLQGSLKLVGTGTYGTITLDQKQDEAVDIGTRRGLTFAGTGKVKAQLTEDPQPGDEVTLFTVASGTPTVAELKKPNGDVIDASYYTVANGVVTFKKEAKIGTQYYFVLAGALDAAGADATVTLCTNVTGFAYTLAKNITFDGDIYEITGDGFTGSGKLTIAGGYIGVTSLPESRSLIGGKYKNDTTWAAETDYHYANLASLSELYDDYKHQIVAGSSGQTDEKVYPAAVVDGSTTNYVGDLAFTKAELKDKGIIESTETSDDDVAKALNAKGKNTRPTWENVVLGLSNTASDAQPVPVPVQGASTTQVSLKLGSNVSVDTASGAKVTYKVMTKGATGGWTTDQIEYGYGDTAEVDLPGEGVKYYKFDVIVTPAK